MEALHTVGKASFYQMSHPLGLDQEQWTATSKACRETQRFGFKGLEGIPKAEVIINLPGHSESGGVEHILRDSSLPDSSKVVFSLDVPT